MRGVGGTVPGRGAAALTGTGRGESGEDQGCGVRLGRPGGEPGAEAEVCRAGDRAGDSKEGVGTVTGGEVPLRFCFFFFFFLFICFEVITHLPISNAE